MSENEEGFLTHTYQQTSRDYEALWDLLRVQRIVCMVNFEHPRDGYQIRDVCQTPVQPRDGFWIDVGCRGYSYISAKDKSDFVAQCSEKNLEYFVPFAIETLIDDIKTMVFVNTDAKGEGSLDAALRLYFSTKTSTQKE